MRRLSSVCHRSSVDFIHTLVGIKCGARNPSRPVSTRPGCVNYSLAPKEAVFFVRPTSHSNFHTDTSSHDYWDIQLGPPSSSLVSSSHDPLDVLLGDVVSFDPETDYEEATHVLVGCPQDIGVRRNCGRPGAADAPDRIREFLYKLKPPSVLESGVRLLDLGNVEVNCLVDSSEEDCLEVGLLEAIHEMLFCVVREALSDGKCVMVLGGGHDISYPDARAVSEVFRSVDPDFAAISVDAHLDMRICSDFCHSGTPYRNLIDSGYLNPSQLHEVGIQPWANSAEYLSQAEEMGVNVHTLTDVLQFGTGSFFEELFNHLLENPNSLSSPPPLFASLDMDAVRASDAPGVSAPSPVGLSGEDVLGFADRCGRYEGRTAVFEVVEVNPRVDVDDRTSRLAALALYVFLYGLV